MRALRSRRLCIAAHFVSVIGTARATTIFTAYADIEDLDLPVVASTSPISGFIGTCTEVTISTANLLTPTPTPTTNIITPFFAPAVYKNSDGVFDYAC